MKLITLTPCFASLLRTQIRKSGIVKEIATVRFARVSRGYSAEVTGRPTQHIHFRSRGVPLCVPEAEASLFENAVICWLPTDLRQSAIWWIDNEGMWNNRELPSDPLGVSVSVSKIRELRPDWFGVRRLPLYLKGKFSTHDRQQWLRYLNWSTQRGDSRAAIVLQTHPLLVSAYSDDLNTAAVLRFPDWLVNRHHLTVGSRLVTINNYERGKTRAADLPPVESTQMQFTNFRPLIAEFLCEDVETIERRRKAIRNDEFELAHQLGERYLRHNQHFCRRGLPFMSGFDQDLVSAER